MHELTVGALRSIDWQVQTGQTKQSRSRGIQTNPRPCVPLSIPLPTHSAAWRAWRSACSIPPPRCFLEPEAPHRRNPHPKPHIEGGGEESKERLRRRLRLRLVLATQTRFRFHPSRHPKPCAPYGALCDGLLCATPDCCAPLPFPQLVAALPGGLLHRSLAGSVVNRA
jgi:hypothetical protein